MKSGIPSVVIILVFFSLTQAQNQKEYDYFPVDSALRYQGIVAPLEFKYDLKELYGKRFFNNIREELLFDNNPSTIWLRTELALSYPYSMGDKSEIDDHFASPLYQKYLEDAGFDMIRYVLGMAQLSAVAYMAYRHIKKYGFWK